jgi:hypothetical protein
VDAGLTVPTSRHDAHGVTRIASLSEEDKLTDRSLLGMKGVLTRRCDAPWPRTSRASWTPARSGLQGRPGSGWSLVNR